MPRKILSRRSLFGAKIKNYSNIDVKPCDDGKNNAIITCTGDSNGRKNA
jgi:hypothetical protein